MPLNEWHRVVSSVVERLVYTEDVGGSKPSPPTINYHLVISTVSPESSDLVTLTVTPSIVTDSPNALGAFK